VRGVALVNVVSLKKLRNATLLYVTLSNVHHAMNYCSTDTYV